MGSKGSKGDKERREVKRVSRRLFVSFFKTGSFTIGGGYAMIPLMEREIVDRYGWLEREEFIDTLAVSQSLPGIFAVNMATHIGYKVAGIKGAIASIIGNILPSLICILVIAMIFREFRNIPAIEHIFMGIRPAVVALIAVPAFNMAKSLKIGWSNFWIPLVAALLISLFGVSPIYVILIACIGGYLYGRLKGNKGEESSVGESVKGVSGDGAESRERVEGERETLPNNDRARREESEVRFDRDGNCDEKGARNGDGNRVGEVDHSVRNGDGEDKEKGGGE